MEAHPGQTSVVGWASTVMLPGTSGEVLRLRVVKSHVFGVASVLGLVLALALSASATTQKHTHKSVSKATGSKAVKSKTVSKTHSSKSTHATAHHTTSKVARSGSSHHGRRVVAKKSWKSQGQHGITDNRAREIQEALVREHYLDGEPSGEWDSRTQEAMRRYQSDNGWQNKVLPDSRALIKLGLGPDHSGVLNPETAATSPYLPGGGVKASVAPAPPVTTQVTDQR